MKALSMAAPKPEQNPDGIWGGFLTDAEANRAQQG
jgi:hypothetical protein